MSASLPPAFSKFHISNFSSTEFSFAKNSSFKPQIPKRSFRISGNSDKLDTPALLDEAPKDVQVVSGDVVAKEERETEGGSKISAAASSAAIEKDLKNVSTLTVHASIGTLIETMAEKLTIEELMALEASIARLSKEMQEVTATIWRNTARIVALTSTTKKTQHSIVALFPSLNNSERNPSLPAKSKEFKELEAAVLQHASVKTQLLQSVNPPMLPPITAFSTYSTTMPPLQTQILPLIPHTSLDPKIAKPPFTTTLQNSLTPHSLSPDLLMENLNPAIMASHGEHGLCSNCEMFHRTFHGSVQNLVPFTGTNPSDNESPTYPFSETVPQHISSPFVSRNLSEVPLTISLHALEGHLVSFTLRL